MDLTVVIASIESSRRAPSVSVTWFDPARASGPSSSSPTHRAMTCGPIRALAGPFVLVSPHEEQRARTLAAVTGEPGARRGFYHGHCLVVPAGPLPRQGHRRGRHRGGRAPRSGKQHRTGRLGVYYLRYARFMPHALGSGPTTGEIAGDNAAYARTALDAHSTTFDRGFWEVDFHRRIRAEGGWLAAVPSAIVEFSRSFPLSTILRHRFVHGRRLAPSESAAAHVRCGRSFWRRLWCHSSWLVAPPFGWPVALLPGGRRRPPMVSDAGVRVGGG